MAIQLKTIYCLISNLALDNVALLLTTLCQFTDDLFNSMDQGMFTGNRLFGPEESIGPQDIGMSGIALSWFQSYLASRCHTTSVGRSLSNSRRISVGVPQGFILEPLLFLINSNNVHKSLQYASIALFADDAALSYSS